MQFIFIVVALYYLLTQKPFTKFNLAQFDCNITNYETAVHTSGMI